VRVVDRADGLGPRVVRTQVETLREPPFQSRLHPVVLAGAEGHDERGGRGPSEFLEQRAAGLIGTDHLTRVNIQVSELANLPGGNVSRLRNKTHTELLLQREIPGLEIASLEVFRIAAERVSARKVDDPVAGLRRLDCRDAVGEPAR